MKHVHKSETSLAEFCVMTGLDYTEKFTLFGAVF